MSISIVVPTYNGEKYLAETLDSVLAQTIFDWELIIVDDGSKDKTRIIVQEYAARDERIRLVAKENGGESTSRNRGFAESDASRPYVIFLDHDDMWEPNALAVLRAALEADPDAIGAYGIGQFVDQNAVPCQPGELEAWCRCRKRFVGRGYVFCQPDEPTTLESLAYHQCIPTPGVCLLRRARLPDGDLFKPSMRTGSGDFHLWLRLARGGHFAFTDTSLIRGRRHADNMTNRRTLIDRSVYEAYTDVLALPDTTDTQRAMLQRGYRYIWRDTGIGQRQSAVAQLRRGQFLPAAKNLARAARSLGRSLRGIPTRHLSR